MTPGMLFRTLTLVAVLAGGLVGTPAAASAGARVYVRIAPPAPVVERVVVARPGRIWVPGYYRWNGRVYVWVAGRHVIPPRRHAVWVPGHWERERRGWFWVAGTWR